MAPAGNTSARELRSRKREWIAAAILVAAIFATFQPSLSAGFIWDDDTHVTANPRVIGPLGFREIWSTTAANYFPLVLTHFRILHAIWGLDPLPYHAVNIALHALAALLCWRVLRRLGIPGAWLAAAVWALHPVQVESVAWISELKNTQSAIFYLLAAWFFIRSVAPARSAALRPALVPWLLALVCALLAILSKPSTVMLPVALLLSWWWLTRTWRWSYLGWLSPFLALSLAASLWTIWEQKFHAGAVGSEWNYTLMERGIIAGRAAWFYLGKLLWPHPIIFVYPRWQVTAGDLFALIPFLLALIVLFVAWRRRAGVGGPVFFALAYFAALIFPVLGFFNVYYFRYSFVADHFQYLASIGPLALAAAGWSALLPAHFNWRHPAYALAAAVVVGLALTSRHETFSYRSNETLFRRVIARNPGAGMAHNNLGNALLADDRIDEAGAHFQIAQRLNPRDADATNNVGSVLAARGDHAGARVQFERALQLQPDHFDAHNNLAGALASAGRWNEAVKHYAEAIRLKPDFANAHYNWGNDLFRRGEVAEAAKHYARAVTIEPAFALAHYNLGVALAELKQPAGAMEHYRRAIDLMPDNADAHQNLALLLQENGQTAAALTHFERALYIDPNLLSAYNNLGTLLRKTGRPAEAIRRFEEALRLKPDAAEIQFNLSLALRDAGRETEAKAYFESARRLKPGLPQEF